MSFTLISVSGQNRNWLCAGGPRFNSRQGRRCFFPLRRPDRFWGYPARARVFPGRQSCRRVKGDYCAAHNGETDDVQNRTSAVLYHTSCRRHRDKCRPTCVINGQVNLVKKILYTVFKILPNRMRHIRGFFSRTREVFFWSKLTHYAGSLPSKLY